MCKKESLPGVLEQRRHDRPGKVFQPRSVHEVCRGSDERIKVMLRPFMPRERRDMTGGNEIDWRRVRILLEVSRVRSKGF